ncbi:MAG TPA: hypothetical protein VHC01_01740 [Gaiellaceae bacterium]|nr:hypothetical protein [Gaiellaceae bacterium]
MRTIMTSSARGAFVAETTIEPARLGGAAPAAIAVHASAATDTATTTTLGMGG